MDGVKNVLLMRFVPEQTQTGLEVLRVWTRSDPVLRHGWEKQLAHWAQFIAHIPDPAIWQALEGALDSTGGADQAGN